MKKEVFIIKYKRTPIGSFLSNLKDLSTVQLASCLINETCIDIDKKDIDIAYIGNVLSAGSGQNIARQIIYTNGIDSPSMTINRVCGSGMQSIIEGYKSIITNESELVLVGGAESMSNSPYLSTAVRKGNKFGNLDLIDSMLYDGLTDPFSKKHMGQLTEEKIEELNMSRKSLDLYAKQSYTKARKAVIENKFDDEIVAVEVNDKKKTIVEKDEEVNKIVDLSKLDTLKSVFKSNGRITAGNASKLSDGACLMLLASKDYIVKKNITPIAKILDYDLSVGSPQDFSIVPVKSIEKLLIKNNFKENDIDYFEINEAFANVPITVHQDLKISYDKINIFGGAISLGHPLGCSGARIVATLLTILRDKNGKRGLASICNGGGGATSLLIELV